MRRITVVLCTLGAVVTLAACGNQAQRDLENVPAQEPGDTHVYVEPDKFPNVATTCIDGLGFVLTTRDYNSIMRVPELDAACQ